MKSMWKVMRVVAAALNVFGMLIIITAIMLRGFDVSMVPALVAVMINLYLIWKVYKI